MAAPTVLALVGSQSLSTLTRGLRLVHCSPGRVNSGLSLVHYGLRLIDSDPSMVGSAHNLVHCGLRMVDSGLIRVNTGLGLFTAA